MAEIQVSSRPSPQSDCVYCRGPLDPRALRWACPSCAIEMHVECSGELERCPTTGCGAQIRYTVRRPEGARPASNRPLGRRGVTPRPAQGSQYLVIVWVLGAVVAFGYQLSRGADVFSALGFGVFGLIAGVLVSVPLTALLPDAPPPGASGSDPEEAQDG